MKRHSFEPQFPAAPPAGLRTRPELGDPIGPGRCVFTELLTWSKKFYAFHTRTGILPADDRRALEAGLGRAIRAAEDFVKD
jgi:hypothetical protein